MKKSGGNVRKQRAGKRSRSVEQAHREILKTVLHGPRRRHLADILAAIPNVGEDSDFVREQQGRHAPTGSTASSSSA